MLAKPPEQQKIRETRRDSEASESERRRKHEWNFIKTYFSLVLMNGAEKNTFHELVEHKNARHGINKE